MGICACLIQQGIDTDTTHTLTAAQTASSEAVTADAGGVVYMVVADTTANPSSQDSNRHPNLTCKTHIWAIVRWLLQHYEIAGGVSLIRSTVYNLYLHHCNENKLNHVNAETSGKLIHHVFLCLTSRRLG
jgi:regulatory factor X 1/2/3